MNLAPAGDDGCPRCGAAFHCGIGGDVPCPCTTLSLDVSLQQRLRHRFTGCLCLACLQALAAGAPLDGPRPARAGPANCRRPAR